MFLAENRFDVQSIKIFAKKIERDPGIELGRLLNDGKVDCYSIRWEIRVIKLFEGCKEGRGHESE